MKCAQPTCPTKMQTGLRESNPWLPLRLHLPRRVQDRRENSSRS